MADLYALEAAVRGEGLSPICGVDEAGRGPLAGPVYAAAVILPEGAPLPGVDDSKKLTEARREALFDTVCGAALAYGIAYATEAEIDTHNILGATYLAMNRAIAAMEVAPGICLIDGNQTAGITYPCRPVVGGDGLCISIAAASILAKVSRDRKLRELDVQYPQYGFAAHKGYPTRAHYAALDDWGPSPVHRGSFLKKWRAGRGQ